MGLLKFLFGSGDEKVIAEPKPDPAWIAYLEQVQARDKEAKRQLDKKRARSAALWQQRYIENMDTQIRYENALTLVQQSSGRNTSQFDLPAVQAAIRQVTTPRTIREHYYREATDKSIIQFFNRCLTHFFRRYTLWPKIIYCQPLRTLDPYDQQFFTPPGNIYQFHFISFQIVEVANSLMTNHIILEVVYHA